MNNKYNVMITYKGDGDFKFKIKRIGEVTVSQDKPIYLYNADTEIIEDLRILKRLLVDITIGAKPDGAYKSYNVEDKTTLEKVQSTRYGNNDRVMSNNDISSILKGGTTGPIEEEIIEPKKEEVVEVKEEVKEEPKKEVKPIAKKTSKKKTAKRK